jgi:hypothetical protein
MSEQVRFKIEGCKVNPDLASICITFVKDENGEYVRYEDYARLKAEVKRLGIERISDLGMLGDKCAEIAALKAEVKRLRKAGDDLEFLVCFNYEGDIKGDNHCMKILNAWSEAKESKPSV